MSNARIAQSGAPRDLYESPANRFVADFIGDANLVSGELQSKAGDKAIVRVGGVSLNLPHRDQPPGEVKLAIRPEAITLEPVKPGRPVIPGTVAKAAYLGTHMEYTVTTEAGEFFVVDRHVARPVAVGADVWLSLADHGITVVPAA